MYCASICRSALLYIKGRKREKPITSYNTFKKYFKQFLAKPKRCQAGHYFK